MTSMRQTKFAVALVQKRFNSTLRAAHHAAQAAAAAAQGAQGVTSLRLNNNNLSELQYATVPTYDRTTLKHGIVHVGVGGFHRAHLAVYVDSMLEQLGLRDWSICGVGLQPFDADMKNALTPQDHLYTVIERSSAGTKARVIGSISDYLFAPDSSEAVIAKMAHSDTHIVSMTITESGYFYNENTHELEIEHPDIVYDLSGKGPPRTFFGYVYAALARRFKAGLKPFTVLSCDNMQKNGDITRNMLLTFVKHRDPEVAAWLAQHGAFPNSMVDRITPRTIEEDVQNLAEEFGVEDAWPVVTEPFMQWVIEDKFADGRPPFEKVGVQVVKEVEEVEQFELTKLRLLNASHSAMGYAGYLAGFQYIHEVIGNPHFHKYILNMMQEEVKPLLPRIPGVDIDEYCKTLISRFSNPAIKDELTRICLGGSGKLPQFIMPSIAEQIQAGGPLRRLTLCTAAWFCYLQGINEQGHEFPLSFDPMAAELQPLARAGGSDPMKLLGVKSLFGDDLRNDERFVTELTKAIESLKKEGALATISKYA
ncbi:NAD(P)-binding protein [Cucurbitaria berberidis CBS 394.84]|uniref:Mannitol 2-dehydrogenase n=1 Tax=Cucurbitaria berberidis CBS 394.84 TaxID=1168544 RepID=A0A9P4GKG4_9PLEO|nr:NAD(P)-binding protein [Cucurbitaria berberidis CBS 394.84]KAF1847079.1 NAD(P)-binding protein [Cucurbitaria berberidis CBS 394.84]